MRRNVYLAGGVRTPFGSFNGSLSSLTAPQLGSVVIRHALEKAGVEAKHVDETIFGNVLQAGVGQNPARQAAIGAGVPLNAGAITVNKVCGSALRSVILAAQAIQCEDAGLIVAGGCESMSNAPYFLRRARTGYRLGHGELTDGMIHDGLWDVYTNKHMAICGDLCSNKYKISREEQDNYSIESYNRAIKAWEDGFFKGQVFPVEVKSKKTTTVVDRDEDVSKYQGPEKLRTLPSAFGPESMITAGNASGINDGAAATIVFGEEKKNALGIRPTAKILGYANAALEPDWFTIAPIQAIRKLCDKLSIKPSDVDLYEINEAFAVVAIVAIRELKLDPAKVNMAGGAVAIGHPIGATGARILNSVIRGLERTGKRLGIACLCIGGGEADAVAVERLG
ncbi:MAG: thiolase family protein [Planctomycetota bacterium]